MHFKNKSYADIAYANIRPYYLIYSISIELLIVCVFITSFYLFSELYYLTAVIGAAGIIALLNLYLLHRSKNTYLCGHIIALVLFLTVLVSNYLTRGIGTSFSVSVWFYVIPVLSVVLVGRDGLFFYASLSLIVIVGCKLISIPAYYSLPANQLIIIDWVNHLFAFLIIISTLNSFKKMSDQYERLLISKNYSLKCEKDRYNHLAHFDALTHLPNRKYFLLNLEAAMATLPNDQRLTLFFMDLDNFKFINDSLGHSAGDDLLIETAKRLKTCFREQDFVARLGGDEFTAFVKHSRDEDISQEIIKRIELAFQQTFHFKNQDYLSSISVGLASYPEQVKTLDELMALADISMYTAKKQKNKDNHVKLI
ncbi:GGDEF domain-containing protein [Legionella brunensis]|uniref:GGDEF/EAL domain-containing sensory box protein n=1 Tax=Legionella brunensis TaxID=29422 RepID=A0A0W0STA3_9GAMM|nr:GGDEF domain-containing protein [Legionella brunensis]KTC86429.1 GGDEF/EAL domain-containing sensory box protein [Legionella brunensis]